MSSLSLQNQSVRDRLRAELRVWQRRAAKLSGQQPLLADKQKLVLDTHVPNPFGRGELFHLTLGIASRADGDKQRLHLKARIEAAALEPVLRARVPQLSHETPPLNRHLRRLQRLPGGKRLSAKLNHGLSEIREQLPRVEPTGDRVATVLEVDVLQAPEALTSAAERWRQRRAILAGPQEWNVDTGEEMLSDGFRAVMTLTGKDELADAAVPADEKDEPDFRARVGVEVRQRRK